VTRGAERQAGIVARDPERETGIEAHDSERGARSATLPLMDGPLLRALADGGPGLARVGGDAVEVSRLRELAAGVAAELEGLERVAVWATPTLETCAAIAAALSAGVVAVPINPQGGERELAHIVADSEVAALLAPRGIEVAAAFDGVPRIDVGLDANATGELPSREPDAEATALVLYTSGTTGPPKGAAIPRRAIASNVDALAAAWAWTPADRLVHALPLFHVHGLVLGVLGPLRLGCELHHLGRFSTAAVGEAFATGGTLMFGVPTMYHRLADDAESHPALADALRRARLLVSGSAPLPGVDHARIERSTGQRVAERYGLTETLINTAVRADDSRTHGGVGRPLDGIEIRLLDDDGAPIDGNAPEAIGEVVVRGPNVFRGYLNRPEATAAALRDGWFHTGDLATRAADGALRIVGRRATDLIKSAGYKIGAGEIEAALLEHPAVAEAAVTGEPDADLGERVVAWVVPAEKVGERDLIDHVARLLAPHKRPREVRFLGELPRNAMGKVRKAELGEGRPAEEPR
jgi:malonyl-CoA/methylmalonyl-CoA synthetase